MLILVHAPGCKEITDPAGIPSIRSWIFKDDPFHLSAVAFF
ncbi:MAG: hypothetical protein ACSW8B_06130 [bacterium]